MVKYMFNEENIFENNFFFGYENSPFLSLPPPAAVDPALFDTILIRRCTRHEKVHYSAEPKFAPALRLGLIRKTKRILLKLKNN